MGPQLSRHLYPRAWCPKQEKQKINSSAPPWQAEEIFSGNAQGAHEPRKY